ncbi:MAG: tRNA (adenosine(37)-N6)-dimethylallyltransferase MiaA [Oscillospiraceae bacterium]|jgi:tRNA dimethylallyltransferase|nr:tRNA (adenosine(37)-N6)-dimethylallyltransferase MiaA [Oscillospiraceae bacterium]
MKPDVTVITGPTATGKTAVAVAFALEYGGEIVNADAMAVYRGMDIGTAKPGAGERRGVPHHLLDVAEAGAEYTVAEYVKAASAAIEDILSRGKRPVIVGGTLFYIESLLKNREFAEGSEKIRAELEAYSTERLISELQAVDPISADKLSDRRRIVRALEVFRVNGRTISDFNNADKLRPNVYSADVFILNYAKREILYNAIDKRVSSMVELGLLDEARELYGRGVRTAAIGYKELFDYFEGLSSFNEAIEIVRRKSRNYAKRQLTWLRHSPLAGSAELIEWVEKPDVQQFMERVYGKRVSV